MTSKQIATKVVLASVIVLTLLFVCSPVAAKPQFQPGGSVACDNRYLWTCDARGWRDAGRKAKPFRADRHRSHRTGRSLAAKPAHASKSSPPQRAAQRMERAPRPALIAEILPHPEGCPRRAFCGCGAAIKVFGQNVRSLWLAANWFRFPPAYPAPGMVAVRRHHVFVIERVIDRHTVVAWDANSGRHLTRRHVRSLAGYSIRDPRSKS